MALTPEVPKLDWPLRLTATGKIAVVDQDTIDDVRKCVRVLLHTPLGARSLAPAVGVPDPTFTAGIDPAGLRKRLEHPEFGEPRAAIRVTAQPATPGGQQRVKIGVDLADAPRGLDADATDEP